MVLPRALIALALCLSAAAATVPTPTIHDETLVARTYSNGGKDGGNHRRSSGSYNDGNNGGNRKNSGDNNDGRGSGNSGSNSDGHKSKDNNRENSGNNDGGHSGDNSGEHNNGGHSSDKNSGHNNVGHSSDNNGGQSGGNGGNRKAAAAAPSQRSIPSRRRALNAMTAFEIAVEICPKDLYACPIAEAGTLSSLPPSLSDWISGGYECIDPQADLRACGGCASLDAKHDCTLIPGANDISCVAGACVVDSCIESYEFNSDSKTCVRN